MANTNIVGNKIKMMRTERNLTQKEFAEQLSVFIGRLKPFGIPIVSAWESGRELPSFTALSGICGFFGVSMEQLTGASSITYSNSKEGNNSTDTSTDASISSISATVPVMRSQLEMYHELPIYVVFKNMEMKDCWGIVNYEKQRIEFINRKYIPFEYIYSNKDNIDLYAEQPFGSIEKARRIDRTMTIPQIKNSQKIWVEMLTYDEYIRGRYNGWYMNNTSKTALINPRADVLPYEGCGYSYNAYSSPLL